MTIRRAVRRWTGALAISILTLAAATPLLADTVWIKTLPGVDGRVQGIANGKLNYETSGGTPRQYPLEDVTAIKVDGESNLNAAEEAFKAKDYDKATSGYERALSSGKPWIKEWASYRLLKSANESKRFDAAVKAFISLAERSPEAARAVTLDLPDKGSKFLDDAIRELDKAIKASRKEETRAVLARLLSDVANQKGDAAAAGQALQQMADARIRANPNSPEAQRAKVLLALNSIKQSLAAREYDKVISEIERQAPTITEPADQLEALVMLAQANEGKAGASTDTAVWKEVAIGYMRVVANAPPGSPQAGSALLRVAAIHETKLNEKPTALKLYQRIAADYKEQQAARDAEKEIKRLQG
jgi:tetratricopeptide (TPR) repeat protein